MIYSIGHSTLTEDAFLNTLGVVPCLWDIRSHPTSKWPQFYKNNMEVWLPVASKQYEWHPELGGWDKRHAYLITEFAVFDVDVTTYTSGKFPKQRIGKGLVTQDTPSWTNQGLWDYQFFMTLPEFMDGVDVLIERGKTEDIAICCAEVLWWKCHRSMVADYIVYLGYDVVHLIGSKQTSHKSALGNRLERYHKYVLQAWSNRKGT